MSRRPCARCNKIILRGKDQSVTCTVCPNLFHLECVEPLELVTARSVHCCFRPPSTAPETTPLVTPSGLKRPASPTSPPAAQISKQRRAATPTSPPSLPLAVPPVSTGTIADVPEYFSAFLSEFREAKIQNTAYFEHIEAKIEQANEERRREVTEIKDKIRSMSQSMVSPDKCEVKLSGIPVTPALTNEQSAQALLRALEIPAFSAHIVELREWSPTPASNPSDPAAPVKAPRDPNFRELVIQFVSPVIRDSVMSKSVRLREKTAQSVFGSGGEHKVYLNQLFSTEVYRLFKLALTKSKELNYLRPVVRNNVVCMRPSPRDPVIPIHLADTLDTLLPRPKRA